MFTRTYSGSREEKPFTLNNGGQGVNTTSFHSRLLRSPTAYRALAAVAVLLLPAPSAAQDEFPPGLPSGPPPAPDLTGRYSPLTCAPNGANCPFIVADLKLTAVGQKMWDGYEEVIGPKFDCAQATPPSLFADPYRFAIHQLTDRVIFEYEKDDIIRTVWLTGWGHPEPGPYDASWQGHSIGWY